jgi:exonuclease III
MAGITKYLSILTLNVNGLNLSIKRHHLTNWIKNEDLTNLQETYLTDRNKHWLRVKAGRGLTSPMAPENRQEQQYLYQTK